MTGDRLPPNSFRLYHRDTPATRCLYPAVANERQSRVQTAQWKIRVVTGPVSAEGEELIDTWSQDDYSAGFGIKDANESTDTARIAFGIIDGRHPRHMCLPPETLTPANPSWASGTFWPLGDIGTQFYGGWSTGGAAGWNVTTGAWYVTQNSWPASFVLAAKPVTFMGTMFFPGGSTGFCTATETAAGTGTLTFSARNTAILARCFGLWDNKLWAIDTSNKIWQLTPTGAAAGAATTANWGKISGSATLTGTAEKDALGNYIVLDTSLTPTTLLTYYDAQQAERLWCITRGQGAYIYNPDEPRWIKSTIKEGSHRDWGLCATVFRDGEDLWIAGGGLDVTRITTANVEIPLSGPSKDQGVPANYNGTIYDLCAERSTLYAFIKGIPSTTTVNFVEDPGGGEAPYVQASAVPMWIAGWSGTAWIGLWEDTVASGSPTWMMISLIDGDSAIWWGGTDGIARRQLLPDPFFNPASRVELGVFPFAPTGWMETVRYDANMTGWDKIASHAFAMLDYADTNTYVDISYRTDADQFDTGLLNPAYTAWKRVDHVGRTLLWFDDVELDPRSGLPWREGLAFQWIQFRFDFVRDPADRYTSPLWMWHSMHHLTNPQDASTFAIKVPLQFDRKIYNRDPSEIAETLMGLQTLRKMLYFQPYTPRRADDDDDEKQAFFRGRVTKVASEFIMGANNNLVEVITFNFIEVGASSNEHTTVA